MKIAIIYNRDSQNVINLFGIPTPPLAVLNNQDFVSPDLTYPLIVKPKNESVSMGISIVNNEEELREAAHMHNAILEFFEQHGFAVDVREPLSFSLGCVQMVLNDNGSSIGVADPRRDGSAGGLHS